MQFSCISNAPGEAVLPEMPENGRLVPGKRDVLLAVRTSLANPISSGTLIPLQAKEKPG